MPKDKLLASSDTLGGILRLVDKYFFSICRLEIFDKHVWHIKNMCGEIKGFHVDFSEVDGRFRFWKEA